MLDDFGESLFELSRRQGLQKIDIVDNERGLVHGAEEVLARARVHRGLATDRAVYHREQSSRNLDVRDAAVKNGGDKSGEIADHAAAQPDDERLSIYPGSDQLLATRAGLFERLRAFASRNDDARRLQAGRNQGRFKLLSKQRGDSCVANDGAPALGQSFADQFTGTIKQPSPDQHIERSRPSADFKRSHTTAAGGNSFTASGRPRLRPDRNHTSSDSRRLDRRRWKCPS